MEHSYFFNQAVAFVKDNVGQDRVNNAKQALLNENENVSLRDVDEDLFYDIYDLMEEFSDDYGLAEGQWLYEGSVDDVFEAL